MVEPAVPYAPQPRLMLKFGGGLNENTDPDISECSAGANFTLELNQQSFVPRPPFDLRGVAPNAGSINGIMQLVKRSGAQTTLVQAGNTVYQWDGSTGFTSKGTVNAASQLRAASWSLGDYLVISDVTLNNQMLTWDGTTLAAMTHTGVAGTLSAKFAVVHLNRVWLFNIVANGVSYPHMILVSKFEDPTNWDIASRGGPTNNGGSAGFTTGLEAFFLLTPDLKPINSAVFFQNSLIISTTDGKIFQLTGTASQSYQFIDFFDTEPSLGVGAMESIGNDVIYLRRGGSIVLLFATQNYGNANVADLSLWLPTTTRGLTTINRIVYDSQNQRVYIFIPNKVLVLFKDLLNRDRYQIRGGMSPWSVYTTIDSSQFNTNAAMYMFDPGTQNYNTFWGDSTGRVFLLNGGGNGDAGSSIVTAYRKSRHIGTEAINPWPWTQENVSGRVQYRRLTPASATIQFDWDEEYSTTSNVISLKGPISSDSSPYFGGNFYFNSTSYFNQGFQAVGRVSNMEIDPGGKGPGFYITVSVPSNTPFQIDSVELD